MRFSGAGCRQTAAEQFDRRRPVRVSCAQPAEERETPISRITKALPAAALLLATCAALAQSTAKMEVVSGKDVTGHIAKRLGLPNQDYCRQQCLEEPRCTGTRWGVISGSTAGQCELLTGELEFHAPKQLKTQDGTAIVVTASKKVSGAQ